MEHESLEPVRSGTDGIPLASSSPLLESTPATGSSHGRESSHSSGSCSSSPPSLSSRPSRCSSSEVSRENEGNKEGLAELERDSLAVHSGCTQEFSPSPLSTTTSPTSSTSVYFSKDAVHDPSSLSFLENSSVSSMESIFLSSGPRLRVMQPRETLETLEKIIPKHHADSDVERVVRDAWKDVFVPSDWYWQAMGGVRENSLLEKEGTRVSRKREREGGAADRFVLPPSSSSLLLTRVKGEHSRGVFPSSSPQEASASSSARSTTPFSSSLSGATPLISSFSEFSCISPGDGGERASPFPHAMKASRRKMVLPRLPHPLNPLGSFYPTREAAVNGSGYCSHHDLVVVGLDKPMTVIALHTPPVSSNTRMPGRDGLHQRGKESFAYACIPGAGQKVFSVLPTSTAITDLSIHPWSSAVSTTSEMVEKVLHESFSSSSSLPLLCPSRSPAYDGMAYSPLPAFIKAMPCAHSRNLYVLVDEVAPVDPFVDIDLALPPPGNSSLLLSPQQKESPHLCQNAAASMGTPMDEMNARVVDRNPPCSPPPLPRHGHSADVCDETENSFAFYLRKASYSVRLAAELVLHDVIKFLIEQFEKLLGTSVQYLVVLSSSYCIIHRSPSKDSREEEEQMEEGIAGRETTDLYGSALAPSGSEEKELIEGKISFHVHFRFHRQGVMHSIRELDVLMRHVKEAATREAAVGSEALVEEWKWEENGGPLCSSVNRKGLNEMGIEEGEFSTREEKEHVGVNSGKGSTTSHATSTPSSTTQDQWARYHRRARARIVLDCVDFGVYNRWRPFRLPYNVKAPTVPAALHAFLLSSPSPRAKDRCPDGSALRPSSSSVSQMEENMEKYTQGVIESSILLSNEIKGFHAFLERISPDEQEEILRLACGMHEMEENPRISTLPPYEVGSVAPQALTEIVLPSPPPFAFCPSSEKEMEINSALSSSSVSSHSIERQEVAGLDTAEQLQTLAQHILWAGKNRFTRRTVTEKEQGDIVTDGVMGGGSPTLQGPPSLEFLSTFSVPRRSPPHDPPSPSPPHSHHGASPLVASRKSPFSLDWDATSLLVIQMFAFRFRCLLPMMPPYTRCLSPALAALLTSYSPFRYSEPALEPPTSSEGKNSTTSGWRHFSLERNGKAENSLNEVSPLSAPHPPTPWINGMETAKRRTPEGSGDLAEKEKGIVVGVVRKRRSVSDDGGGEEEEEEEEEKVGNALREEERTGTHPLLEGNRCPNSTRWYGKPLLTPLSINILFHLTIIQRSFTTSSSVSTCRLLMAPSLWKSPLPFTYNVQKDNPAHGREGRLGSAWASTAATATATAGVGASHLPFSSAGYFSSSSSTTISVGKRMVGDYYTPRKSLRGSSDRIAIVDIEMKRKIAEVFYALHPAFTGAYDNGTYFFEPSVNKPIFYLPGVVPFSSSSIPSSSCGCFGLPSPAGEETGRGGVNGKHVFVVESQRKRIPPPPSRHPHGSLDFSAISFFERRNGYRAIVPELLRIQYQEAGVRCYYVTQKQNKFCLKLQRCHRATFTQLFLTYGSIKVRCYSNDCYDSFLWIPWSRPPPPSSSSSSSDGVDGSPAAAESTSTEDSCLQESSPPIAAPYPQYERLAEIHKFLFPELSPEEVLKRYKDPFGQGE